MHFEVVVINAQTIIPSKENLKDVEISMIYDGSKMDDVVGTVVTASVFTLSKSLPKTTIICLETLKYALHCVPFDSHPPIGQEFISNHTARLLKHKYFKEIFVFDKFSIQNTNCVKESFNVYDSKSELIILN